ncbi:MAG: hypothetical protein V7K27_11910 [Nostoc sp.]|uniref:hypothetical protein n=1 Tax=Nostoc sp. TaxID=1180 RepID=UPI002FF4E256
MHKRIAIGRSLRTSHFYKNNLAIILHEMDVIPLDASLLRGSHGNITTSVAEWPLFITHQTHLVDENRIEATDVCSLILKHLNT